MNIYTLHKEGSFRPPASDCDSEIENSQSSRGQRLNNNLAAVEEEKVPPCSTSLTSNTSGTGTVSSSGDKTTTRSNHNTQPCSSRIDATGAVITEVKCTVRTQPKAASKTEGKAAKAIDKTNATTNAIANVTSSPSILKKKKKSKNNGLIHIQARDEFMIFKDDTDLVSHITTPSALRTSPLETDFLLFDHKEFEEEADLVSAITVPKSLRKKKSRKKSRSKNSSSTKVNDKQQSKSKIKEKESRNREQGGLKSEEATKKNESEVDQVKEDSSESSTPKAPKFCRQNSIEPPKNKDLSQKSSGLRGGKRGQQQEQKPTDKAATPLSPTPGTTSEDGIPSSKDDKEESKSEAANTSKQIKVEQKVEKNDNLRDRNKKGDPPEDRKQKLKQEENSKATPPNSKTKIVKKAPVKPLVSQKQDIVSDARGHRDEVKKLSEGNRDEVKKPSELAEDKNSSRSRSIRDRRDDKDKGGDTTDRKNVEKGRDFSAQANTVRMPNANIEKPDEVIEIAPHKKEGKVSSRGMGTLWWLPTSHFCCNRRRKKRIDQLNQQNTQNLVNSLASTKAPSAYGPESEDLK
mmetsp:Transcript_28673/g.61520  ORF Transcript_28673/g.61520 Transcript_28673/m.61520 type:complete len:575 (+) Transcript_28673:113-1837(+)|eukprot:CAMPEP_0201135390 /NCGR_PEP_ID=MMETSP0850-20130426/54290_1 /ASSEMBLY_ACC=CAM_ASM_000622 /TAXON_ID=183588 /ORGANISM="Pseudo-nitzschia fraudulenta, Strain WWA7" /LENGTH=574 /DNA_ID=CAMNT_0047406553 /DNA_START=195 /DNA_END=1919 /DNA_ORIENTATION=-